MAEGSLSVSVPAWRLRTDTEIGGGISKLNVANLRTGGMRIRSRICALRCLRCDLKQIHGICNCACVRTCAAYRACAIAQSTQTAPRATFKDGDKCGTDTEITRHLHYTSGINNRAVNTPAEIPKAESDSDSGVGSPMEEAGTDAATDVIQTEEAQDSDEDIVVNRKPRTRKVLQDSDSEQDEDVDGMAEALVLSESSGEGTNGGEGEQPKKSRGKKITRIAMSSDESEPEEDEHQGKSKEETKKRGKSQRRKEKETHRGALVKQLKEKIRTSEESPLPKVLNDSGCLLGDNDLFDAQLEEEVMEEEDEESLDAIRAAVKKKAKNQPHLDDSEEDEVQEGKSQRKERKAARASKEAMKQLHSDCQRIVRESTIGLPYHMPEPKGIDHFFKRRVRPDRPAMALLKSPKYQACIVAASTASSTTQKQSEAPEQNSDPQAELNVPAPISGTQQTGATNELDTSTEATDDQSEVSRVELQNPEVMEEVCVLPSVDMSKSAESPKEDHEMSEVQLTKTGTGQSGQGGSVLSEQGTAAPKPKKDKLARLRELGLEPPPVAKLCADDGAFVQLEPQQTNPGLEALKERFLKHVQPAPRSKRERSLHVNVVRKERAASGQEQLCSESITVTVNEEEEEPVHTKPGEKLVLLKSRLQQAMAIRRKEERERRAALYRLDNEECEEEEEAEMTESEEEEGIEDLLGDGEEANDAENDEEEVEGAEVGNALKRSVSPSFKSPSPTPYTDGTLMLFAGSSCSRTGDGVRQSGQANHENDSKMDDDGLSLNKDNSHNSSFELTSSTLPSYQPVSRTTGKGLSAAVFRSPSPCFFRPSFLGSASKSSGKLSEPSLTLPVEDSQDLYGVPSPENSEGPFSQEEDTQSQLLDADGFLNVGPRGGQSRSHKRQLLLDNLDENAMDANMGELLGLCSGGFGSVASRRSQPGGDDELLGLCSGAFSTQNGDAGTPKVETGAVEMNHAVGESHGSSDADMDQLLSLCSGKFTGSPATSPVQPGTGPALEDESDSKSKVEEEEEEEEEDNCEFRLLSDVDSNSEKGEDEEDSDGEGDVGDEVEDEEKDAVFRRHRGKKIPKPMFMDSEAELSGSDVGSDDEDDEEDDEYEDDDIQEQLPSDDELMDQVNKIHMKQVLDDDKRKLRIYQERYLADGDLHSDGPGRERRFRWKNIDDNFELGVAAEGEEEEAEEDVDQHELQRQKERLEREQWLREQSETSKKAAEVEEEEEDKIGEEDSQFMKLAKKLTAKALQKKAAETSSVLPQEKPVSNTNPFQKPCKPIVRTGSLLSQPRAVLQKLANISEGNPLAPRNSRGFLFQTLSPEKEAPTSASSKKQIKKRAQTDTSAPVAKRQCRENSVKTGGTPRSIFSFYDN
ncbi:claspin isoform X2 [Tachysurus fulvidraco]|uniref:claspin isoform X2 n=1 Tax=Tachysurus fulvidraco TaxID=1234273 RepID=UPI001FED33C2|nr:claspin isoform X2 [Tachysurus fulvidraco]